MIEKLCKHLLPIKEHLIIVSEAPASMYMDKWYCKTCGLKLIYNPEECGIEVRDSL